MREASRVPRWMLPRGSGVVNLVRLRMPLPGIANPHDFKLTHYLALALTGHAAEDAALSYDPFGDSNVRRGTTSQAFASRSTMHLHLCGVQSLLPFPKGTSWECCRRAFCRGGGELRQTILRAMGDIGQPWRT